NLTTSGSGAYSDGYTSSNGIITWTPASTAITSSATVSEAAVSETVFEPLVAEPEEPVPDGTSNTAPYSSEGSNTYYYTSGTTDNDTGTQSTCLAANGNDEEYCKHWHVGNYYNWTAAIASNDSSSISTQYTNAANSICPSGWTLPYGADSGDTATYREFGQLLLSAGITTSLTATSYATNGFTNIRIAPLFFVRGGGVEVSSQFGAASYGRYWSSSVFSASSAYTMHFYSSGLNSANDYSSRYRGFSVRCLVRPITSIDQISTLQQFAKLSSTEKSAVLNSMTTNTVYQKTDSRDGEVYNIAKLADGNIWFLDNLRLDLTDSTVKTKLTSATTNATDTALNCLTGRTTGCASPYTTAAVVTPVNWTYTEAEIATDYSTTINSDSSKNYGNGSHMYGVYYNFCAASAGSYCYDSEAGTGNASEDICPAGWRMSTGGSTGEWGALDSLINNRTASDSASIQARLSLPLSGFFEDGRAGNQGLDGFWWSSTVVDNAYMYVFRANATNATTFHDGLGTGYSMRCLFSAS
ncbi:hypothetical protein IJG90_02930, partial [Candidatus Saccharibacteria bacterium]|nr:hypothetical protein [Candidatus Saccharibacteria bacterium]